jgi:hypothetical protein
MGNRGGAIHDGERRIIGAYASRRWITCVLEFKGRRRPVMAPGRYTELFFLDEAVSLAAAHRPCAECRRERFNAFKEAWIRSGNWRDGGFLYADRIDEELHRARIDGQKAREKAKVTHSATLNSLPDGCFVRIAGADYPGLGACAVSVVSGALHRKARTAGQSHRYRADARADRSMPQPWIHAGNPFLGAKSVNTYARRDSNAGLPRERSCAPRRADLCLGPR